MSKRGRRRSSRRRKSSSSSKQSVSQYIFHKPNKNNKEDIAEKGETDSFGKEYVASLSEDEEKYTNFSPPKEKRSKYDYQVNVFPNQRNIYTATTNDREKGVKIVTSVSVDDMDDSAPNITFLQSQEPLQTNPCNTGSSIMKINCKGSKVKLEIQEVGTPGVKTTFVLCNEKHEPNNDQPTSNWTLHSQSTPNFSFTFNSTSEPMETHPSANNTILESQSSNQQHLLGHKTQMSTNLSLSNNYLEQPPIVKPLERRKQFGKSYSSDQSWDIPPPPQEFADNKCSTLDNLVFGVASCRIGSCSPSYNEQLIFLGDSRDMSDNEFTLDTEGRLDLDQLSDSDNYDPMSLRPSVSTNRSSFTKDFINCQKTKPLIRNNSIATVEHKTFLLPTKRRQTFPRLLQMSGSMQEEHMMHFRESFSSDTTSSLSAQTGRQKSIYEDRFTVVRSYNSSKEHRRSSRGYHCVDFGRQLCNTDFVNIKSVDIDDCGHQGDVGDSGIDQENADGRFSLEPPTDELNRKALAIQVIPPSCTGSAEQMLQSQLDTGSSSGLWMEQDLTCMASSVDVTEDLRLVPYIANSENTTYFSPLISEEVSELHLGTKVRGRIDSVKSISLACIAETSADTNKKTLCRSVSDVKEFLRPMESSGCDPWAKRRKLFKESKQRSSTGEGSITSDITEGSISEDGPSLDMTTQDTEEGGFYTETFHSAAWLYQGDSITSEAIPASLNSRSRVVSIRERTVRINKGTGDYPWGFRIQFSKPIVVTEVDTNGAAEEAGLMVGDYVVAVNGTDVTSIPHSEAADLARQGPDILTLTIGSDIARGPNTPRPGCRGYLHKRTQSGLIKGWRKRWFVLTHDCCLHYYRHKRDEGKRQALSTIKLEGAEVGPDLSLGKPFVFKCRPLLANRVYFFCATSNKEMKRWLDALEKAFHPITQNHVWVDVTSHNSGLPPLAVKNPDCLGLLHKMDKIKDTWVQHYCILKDACLYLYSGIRATHAHGGIYLQGYTVREQPYGSRKCTIELKPPSDEFKSFYLCAENPNDNKRWIVAIKASIKKWLPLHQVLQDYNNLKPEETRM